MSKSLVIVESPAKAKTINQFLGKGFIVKASIGHVKDLPKSKLGVDVENNFKATYEVIKSKVKVISELKKAAKGTDKIYLAPDPDREGEAIAWHISEEVGGDGTNVFRVLFNEITKKAVLDAIKNPLKLDKHKYESQQARRILDRLVGYEISPLLWQKVRYGLSAGRVQSVAVRLVCERERAIQAFVPQEYWSMTAELETKGKPAPAGSKQGGEETRFNAKLAKKDDKKIEIKTEEEAKKILADIEGAKFVVSNIETKERKRNPLPPFITSKLQQDAARKLGFTAKKTMLLAQQLYEGIELGNEGSVGLITYMRTDSTRIAGEAIEEARQFINSNFGKEYLPSKPNVYPSRKNAQGAHEAIRPTYFKHTPASIKDLLSKDHFNLYQLIWNRFIACQMSPALLDQTSIQIEAVSSKPKAPQYLFQTTGSVIKFPGFIAVYTEARDEEEKVEEENILPVLSKGEILSLITLLPEQHFTQPPPRFTEASLVKELEENGIGRPSTYAAILSTIQEREYALKEKGKFIPTELGFLITDLLIQSFPKIVDVEFTAHLEEQLDEIEEGKLAWLDAMREFYGPFKDSLKKAKVEMKDIKKEEVPTEVVCDKCGKTMVIKWGRNGKFLACPGYPECKNTKNFTMDGTGKILIQIPKIEESNEPCPKCSKLMLVKTGRFGRFLACSDYPACKTTKPIPSGINCPEQDCGGMMVEKRSKKGQTFYSCSNYPKCKYAIWDKPLHEKCPECNHPFLVEKYSKKEGTVIKCPKEDCGYKKETDAVIAN